jgi:hypothetical protein
MQKKFERLEALKFCTYAVRFFRPWVGLYFLQQFEGFGTKKVGEKKLARVSVAFWVKCTAFSVKRTALAPR